MYYLLQVIIQLWFARTYNTARHIYGAMEPYGHFSRFPRVSLFPSSLTILGSRGSNVPFSITSGGGVVMVLWWCGDECNVVIVWCGGEGSVVMVW